MATKDDGRQLVVVIRREKIDIKNILGNEGNQDHE